jgi:2-oxo-3-hexenedioate decarboxylase
MTDLTAIAQLLDDAARHARAIPQLSTSGFPLELEQAYEVQARSISRRLDRGERLIGIKMGFTSQAKMRQMGVDDMIWGRLTDTMALADGGSLDLHHYVHPRVEPEIAFRLGAPLRGDVSLEAAMAAVNGVAVAMEVIDSRYENFKFSLADVVADNSSSSGFVIGPWQAPGVDISALPISLKFDGLTVEQGSSAAILGNPYQSLVEAARLAGASGITLEAGWIVLAGGATAAAALRPGTQVTVETPLLGSAALNIAT